MNVVCWFTKFVISVPVPDAKSTTLVNAFLTNCYLKFGGCTKLITDNATAFTSEFFREFCAMLYISKRYAIPHWSQGKDFDEHLEAATFCYNTAVHQSTGETPFFLMVVHINQLKKSFDGLGPACTVPELTENEKDALLGAQAEELQNQPGYSYTPNSNPDFASSENPQMPSDSNIAPETSENATNPQPSYGLQNRMSLRRPHKFD
ncbi:hypothetical protein niasHS_006950 [Heterodera schachtii]|uniref:Integrase catalytic domain-containing protein n=1 Tax=Heterodera schachtii TaxID=97005 RepID=A0ABD2JG55_HETSC